MDAAPRDALPQRAPGTSFTCFRADEGGARAPSDRASPVPGPRVGTARRNPSWPPGSEMTVGDFFGGTRRGKNEVSAVGTGAVPDWARVEARAKDPRRHSTHRALRPSLKVRPPSLCPTSRSLSSTRPHARASAGVELQSFTSRARLDFREVFARARAERRRRGRPRRRGSPRRARRRRASSAQTSAKRTSVAAAAPFCARARVSARSRKTWAPRAAVQRFVARARAPTTSIPRPSRPPRCTVRFLDFVLLTSLPPLSSAIRSVGAVERTPRSLHSHQHHSHDVRGARACVCDVEFRRRIRVA